MLARARGASRLRGAALPVAGSLSRAAVVLSWRGAKSAAARSKQPRAGPSSAPRVVSVPELCSAARFAELTRVPLPTLEKHAALLGEPIRAADTLLNPELMELLGLECGLTLQMRDFDAHSLPLPSGEARALLPVRAPVVTLMGHVDHGKTSLLDAFRGSRLVDGEAGGITQGISAFTVAPETDSCITFIDTPGHALFAAMRERGARATDLVVLVVAINAGVQPTTIEAIRYAKETDSPLIVAANKVDLPDSGAMIEKLRQDLLANDVMLEDLGGDVPLLPVSATKHIGLEALREAILLQAEILELRAERSGPAEGVVLEAFVSKGLGNVAVVLVQRGKLRVGECVVVGSTWGRVKALQDELGARIDEALPSTPVRLVGLRSLPGSGDALLAIASEDRAKEVVDFRLLKARAEAEATATVRRGRRQVPHPLCFVLTPHFPCSSAPSVPNLTSRRRTSKLVPALLKADAQGSLEAAREGLAHFPTNRVELKFVKAAVGNLTDADVQLAHDLGAFVVGFNTKVESKAARLANQLDVRIQNHDVIYSLVDGIKESLEAAIEPVLEDKEKGRAEVLELFTLTLTKKERKDGMSKFTTVAGSKVVSGEASNKSKVRVTRLGDVVHEGDVISLKHFKQEVRTLKKGAECGIIIKDFGGIKQGDMLSFYEVVPRRPSLYDEIDELAESRLMT